MSLICLPNDILLIICRDLDFLDLVSLSKTRKTFFFGFKTKKLSQAFHWKVFRSRLSYIDVVKGSKKSDRFVRECFCECFAPYTVHLAPRYAPVDTVRGIYACGYDPWTYK